MNKKILIIGLTWPEPEATAAGVRMLQLIAYFLSRGKEVVFASAASKNKLSFDFSTMPVECIDIQLNSDTFDSALKKINPDIVLFDRFISEEQYGWRVKNVCPEATLILDTEDLHFLRKAREIAVSKNSKDWMSFIKNDLSLREIASIYRCDLSLIISKQEIQLLLSHFKVPAHILFYLPLFAEPQDDFIQAKTPSFEARKHFMSIGNFKHKPNLDSISYLKKEIWPIIRKELPKAEMHIYGAYCNTAAEQMHDIKLGFLVKGWVDDKKNAFINSKVCLAPLRFGAGQKGKLLDAMYFGTPSVTTSIGAEGMSDLNKWNGFIEDEPAGYAEKAIALYKDKTIWTKAQQIGYDLIREHHNKESFILKLDTVIDKISSELNSHRESNFIGSMLSHHSMKSTMYLSKWIAIKNLSNDKIIE